MSSIALDHAGDRTTDEAHPDHDRRWWILAVLAAAQLMVVLDATVVNIALPSAQADLGFGDADRQWIVTAYALAFGSLLLLGGRLADLFGRKWVFLIGLVGFAIASAVGGAAPDFAVLVTARAVQGVFGALLAPAGLALLTTTFVLPGERGKAFGIYGAIAGAGAAVGLLLGGILTEYLSWRWCMYVNLIFAVVALIGGLLLLVHRPAETRPKLDIPGTITVSTGLFGLVYGFSHAETAGWADSVTLASLGLAVVMLIAFVVLQTRVAHPLLPLRIVLDRNRGGAYLAVFIVGIGLFGVFLFLTFYMSQIMQYSPVKTGLAFIPMSATIIVIAAVGSVLLATRVSPKWLVSGGMVAAAIGLALLTRIGIGTSYAGVILPATMVMGAGLGTLFASAISTATLGVSGDDSGVASATVNMGQQVGGSVGTALLSTIAASAATAWVKANPFTPPAGATVAQAKALAAQFQAQAAVHSYITAFWVGAAIFAMGAIICGLLIRPGVPDFDAGAAPAIAH